MPEGRLIQKIDETAKSQHIALIKHTSSKKKKSKRKKVAIISLKPRILLQKPLYQVKDLKLLWEEKKELLFIIEPTPHPTRCNINYFKCDYLASVVSICRR